MELATSAIAHSGPCTPADRTTARSPAAEQQEQACQRSTILIVDDEPINVLLVQNCLVQSGYARVVTVTDPAETWTTILRDHPDVILLDIVMPGVSGLEILTQIRQNPATAHLPVIILTASDDEETQVRALERGATDFLAKPVRSMDLLPRVRNALLVKAHHDHLQDYARSLEREVRLRTAELAASRLELIHCLARVAEYRDNETGRHVMRVGRYSGIIARKMGLEPSTVELIEHAAPLHDIGKIGIPDSILLKRDKLTPDEYQLMQKHVLLGKRTFEQMTIEEWKMFRSHTFVGEMIMDLQTSPLITMAAQIALSHHERWDGTGYPLGLAREEIPLAGRIVAVADVFDALSSKRPYKPPLPMEECLRIMIEGRGTQFAPAALDAFLNAREEVVRTRVEFADLD
jgi:putative two-component system response regulator